MLRRWVASKCSRIRFNTAHYCTAGTTFKNKFWRIKNSVTGQVITAPGSVGGAIRHENGAGNDEQKW